MRVVMIILVFLIYEAFCVRYKLPVHQQNSPQNKTKCIFYIKKGCPISRKIYVNGKREIERRLRESNQTQFTYADETSNIDLPICDRANLTLYEPIYVINEHDRAKILATMLGAYDNSTETIISAYKLFLDGMCATKDRFRYVSFINMLKILVCELYTLSGTPLTQTFVLSTITRFTNSLKTFGLFNNNISQIQDSIFFNPAFEQRIATSQTGVNMISILPRSIPFFQSLKKTLHEENGFRYLKHYATNVKNVYSTIENIPKNSADEKFIHHFKREYDKRRDKITKTLTTVKQIIGGIPKVLSDDKVNLHTAKFMNEAYFTTSRLFGYVKNIKNTIYHGYIEYFRHNNHSSPEWIKNYAGSEIKPLFGKYRESADKHLHFLHSINTHLIRTRKERENLHNIERKYYEGRTLVYNKYGKKYKWKDDYYDENNSILKWRGFVVGGLDSNGNIITNVFNINSLTDDLWGVFYLSSYIFNPFVKLIGISNTIFNEETCTPYYPKLPDTRLGCTYPEFESVPLGSGILGVFPVGFDFLNPNCDAYLAFGGWSLGFVRMIGTLVFGRFVISNPALSNFIGINYIVLNVTGLEGLAALPSNLVPCLIVFSGWSIVFALVVVFIIASTVFLIIYFGKVEIRYIMDKEKRAQQWKLDLIDYEQSIALTAKTELRGEINRRLEDAKLTGKTYNFTPNIDPNVKLYIDNYLNQHFKK